MSVTLATARQEVSKRCDEFIAGTATGGTTTTLIDTNKLTHADDYWAEATVLLTSGTNNGLERRISAFAASTSTCTLYSAATAAIANNDTYELRRRFSVSEYIDLAINRAINIAAPDFREHVRVDVTVTSEDYDYPVPISSNPDIMNMGLIAVEYGDTSLNATKPLARLPASLYEITEDYVAGATNANVKTIVLKFNPFTGHTLRLIFDGPLANVSSSTDRIKLDLPELEFLYSQAVAEVWRIHVNRTVDANRQAALTELARSEAYADRLRRAMGMERKQAQIKRTVFRLTGL